MKTLRLQEISAEKIHVMCLRSDDTTFCIDTRKCTSLTVPNDVVDAVVLPIPAPFTGKVSFKDKVDFIVV